MSKTLFFSSFIIKIIAFVLMACDHIGLALVAFFPYDMDVIQVSNILRGFGRLALPLFIFMITEGVIHTKSIKQYLLRLGIMASVISTILIIITYVDFGDGFNFVPFQGVGNIFIDLVLTALTIYLLKQKNNYLKLLILLSLGISFASFFVKSYEYATGAAVHWYPNWLYLQFDWMSIVLGIGFYYSYKLADIYIENTTAKNGMDKSIWEVSGRYRLLVNAICLAVIGFVNIVFYLYKYVWPEGTFWDANTQLFAIFSGAFILLYNGKRGYNAKWFQYGSYLFYPVHIIIIIVICALVSGGI